MVEVRRATPDPVLAVEVRLHGRYHRWQAQINAGEMADNNPCLQSARKNRSKKAREIEIDYGFFGFAKWASISWTSNVLWKIP